MNRWFWKVWASVVGVAVLAPAAIFVHIRRSAVVVDRADSAALMEWFTANEDGIRLMFAVGKVSAFVLACCGVAASVRLFSRRGTVPG